MISLSDSEPRKAGGAAKAVRIVFIVVGILFLVIGLPYLLAGIESGDFTTLILGFLMFTFFFSFLSAARRGPVQTPIFRTVTVSKCSKCEYTQVRDFQKGDYVYKTLGKCKDCEGEMFIRSIYTIPVGKTQLSAS
jgi:hypothetical protein